MAAYVLGWLYEREILPKFACQIAVGVLHAVRRSPEVETLSAWKCWKGEKPHVVVSATAPRDNCIELFKFKVGKIRREAEAGVRRKARETAKQQS